MSQDGISRRHFFYGSLLAGAVPAAGFGSVASLKKLGYKSPNEKLGYAAVGAGGKGYSDIMGCQSENLIAMADPDQKRCARAIKQFEKTPRYDDFRVMLDKHDKEIDAVTIAIPDHMHGTVAAHAMSLGKGVYTQKPLVRTYWEAQQLLDISRKYGVATQMGNQGYSNEGARQACEIIWNGDIGNVTEVHAWTDRPRKYWPQGPEVKPEEAPVPETLNWEAWLGASPTRPYSPAYVPHNWRGFPEYGCGAIGDMACHILGTPNMALRLGERKFKSVQAMTQEGKGEYTFPQHSVLVYEFDGIGSMPPVKVTWHDGMPKQPDFPGVPEGELLGDSDVNGSLFIGDKGMLTTGCYGERTRLVPAAKMADYKMPPQWLTRSPGHYRDWLRACKGGDPACSNFEHAVPFVSWMLTGVIAMKYDGKLEWDSAKSEFANNKDANKWLKPTFRKGWKFAG